MKFVTLFAVGAVAALSKRDQVTNIATDIAILTEATNNITREISSYTESADNVQSLRDTNKALIEAISQADGDSKAVVGTLNDLQAASLTIAIQNLGQAVGQAVDAAIQKKTQFVEECHGMEIWQAFRDQQSQALAFKRDLMSKLSLASQTIGSQITLPIMNNLQRGVDAYADQNKAKCVKDSGNDTPKTTASPSAAPAKTSTSVSSSSAPAKVQSPAPVSAPTSGEKTPLSGSKTPSNKGQTPSEAAPVDVGNTPSESGKTPSDKDQTPAEGGQEAAAPVAAVTAAQTTVVTTATVVASTGSIVHPTNGTIVSPPSPTGSVITGAASKTATGFGVAAIAALAVVLL